MKENGSMGQTENRIEARTAPGMKIEFRKAEISDAEALIDIYRFCTTKGRLAAFHAKRRKKAHMKLGVYASFRSSRGKGSEQLR